MSRYTERQQWRKLYNRKAWRELRARQLLLEPVCRRCSQLGRTTPANVCDHIVPHKGNVELFHDPSNLQSLCKPCHDGWKHRQEIGALEKHEFDASGYPIKERGG